ncbi:MAG: hypothetical protein AUI50_01440 [Crenarchaeota archaeon 13_1_40CM_2_52_14]|nr:MAG: hypothetical protein AUI50_01440 [Crenarchaeota archaeon 13_1_40CM_2_52_14]OLE69865.1 MAG: hypothetical protein AUF78_09145 [archaeon 13_1_20CM_2_51_12]
MSRKSRSWFSVDKGDLVRESSSSLFYLTLLTFPVLFEMLVGPFMSTMLALVFVLKFFNVDNPRTFSS